MRLCRLCPRQRGGGDANSWAPPGPPFTRLGRRPRGWRMTCLPIPKQGEEIKRDGSDKRREKKGGDYATSTQIKQNKITPKTRPPPAKIRPAWPGPSPTHPSVVIALSSPWQSTTQQRRRLGLTGLHLLHRRITPDSTRLRNNRTFQSSTSLPPSLPLSQSANKTHRGVTQMNTMDRSHQTTPTSIRLPGIGAGFFLLRVPVPV